MGRETVLFFVFNGIGVAIELSCVAIVQDGLHLNGKVWYNVANLACTLGWARCSGSGRTASGCGGRRSPPAECPPAGIIPSPSAPGFPEAGVVEAVAVGLDEEATLYGRGAEIYDERRGLPG